MGGDGTTTVGEAGSDHVFGDAGDDVLAGGKGKDKLYGGDGDDLIVDGDLRGDDDDDRHRIDDGPSSDGRGGGTSRDDYRGDGSKDLLDGGADHHRCIGDRTDTYVDCEEKGGQRPRKDDDPDKPDLLESIGAVRSERCPGLCRPDRTPG